MKLHSIWNAIEKMYLIHISNNSSINIYSEIIKKQSIAQQDIPEIIRPLKTYQPNKATP